MRGEPYSLVSNFNLPMTANSNTQNKKHVDDRTSSS
jgi:hypothetical protein